MAPILKHSVRLPRLPIRDCASCSFHEPWGRPRPETKVSRMRGGSGLPFWMTMTLGSPRNSRRSYERPTRPASPFRWSRAGCSRDRNRLSIAGHVVAPRPASRWGNICSAEARSSRAKGWSRPLPGLCPGNFSPGILSTLTCPPCATWNGCCASLAIHACNCSSFPSKSHWRPGTLRLAGNESATASAGNSSLTGRGPIGRCSLPAPMRVCFSPGPEIRLLATGTGVRSSSCRPRHFEKAPLHRKRFSPTWGTG